MGESGSRLPRMEIVSGASGGCREWGDEAKGLLAASQTELFLARSQWLSPHLNNTKLPNRGYQLLIRIIANSTNSRHSVKAGDVFFIKRPGAFTKSSSHRVEEGWRLFDRETFPNSGFDLLEADCK